MVASSAYAGYFDADVLRSIPRRTWLAAACALIASSTRASGDARAQAAAPGHVDVSRRTLRERDEAWRLLMSLRLSQRPSAPTVQARFVFSQHLDFLEDSDGGPGVREPVEPPRIVEETRDVDFRDLSGHVGIRGRTQLQLTRSRGFRAGVWRMRVFVEQRRVGGDVEIELAGVNGKRRPPTRPAEPDAGADASS